MCYLLCLFPKSIYITAVRLPIQEANVVYVRTTLSHILPLPFLGKKKCFHILWEDSVLFVRTYLKR